MRIIRRDELIETPWKNGGGITREIAETRTGAKSDGALIWRLSMADVAGNGRFSSFAGLTRILTVIKGNGMTLVSPDAVLEADYGRPVRFDGALAITAKLKNGPLTDLNLIFDQALCDGDVTPVHGPARQRLEAGAGAMLGVHCLCGAAEVGDGQRVWVGDTGLVEDGAVEMRVDEEAVVLLIRLARVGAV